MTTIPLWLINDEDLPRYRDAARDAGDAYDHPDEAHLRRDCYAVMATIETEIRRRGGVVMLAPTGGFVVRPDENL